MTTGGVYAGSQGAYVRTSTSKTGQETINNGKEVSDNFFNTGRTQAGHLFKTSNSLQTLRGLFS